MGGCKHHRGHRADRGRVPPSALASLNGLLQGRRDGDKAGARDGKGGGKNGDSATSLHRSKYVNNACTLRPKVCKRDRPGLVGASGLLGILRSFTRSKVLFFSHARLLSKCLSRYSCCSAQPFSRPRRRNAHLCIFYGDQ